jgi:hypothetical protein
MSDEAPRWLQDQREELAVLLAQAKERLPQVDALRSKAPYLRVAICATREFLAALSWLERMG